MNLASFFEEIGTLSQQQPQDISRLMEIAEIFGLEILCRPAREYKSSCIPAKAGAREGILR
jgi:hypothetical protein